MKNLNTVQKRLEQNNACEVIVGTRLAHQYRNTIACYIIEKARAQIEVTKLKNAKPMCSSQLL